MHDNDRNILPDIYSETPAYDRNILSDLYLNYQAVDSSSSFANWFILKAGKEGNEITNLKIQKLLYLSYGLYIAKYEKLLFGELIEAWKYGPVINTVYEYFKRYGNDVIKLSYQDFMGEYLVDKGDKSLKYVKNLFGYKEHPKKRTYFEIEIDDQGKQIQEILEYVWKKCKNIDAFDLSKKTHKSKKINGKEINPWVISWNYGIENNLKKVVIPPKNIFKYFKESELDDIIS